MSEIDYGFEAKCNHCNERIIMYQKVHGQVTRCPWCSYMITVSTFTKDTLTIYPPTYKDEVTRIPYKGEIV